MVTLYESPITSVAFLSLENVITDEDRLQVLCRRQMPFPVEVQYQISEGRFMILMDCDDQPKLDEAGASYYEATTHIEQNHPAEAIPFLRRLLELNPYFMQGRMDLVLLLYKLEQTEESLDEIVEGLRIDPEIPEYYALAAVQLPETAEMTPTRKHCTSKAIEHGTSDPMVFYVMGTIALDEGNFPEALRHYDAMLTLPKGKVLAHYGRAHTFNHMGRFKSAAAELETFFSMSLNHVPDDYVMPTARSWYLFCCSQLAKRTEAARLRLARRELARIEAECGWSIEVQEAASEAESSTLPNGLLWQSRDRPGSVVIRGPREAIESPDFLLTHALEIRVETLPSGPRVLQNLRQQAARMARNSCKIPDRFETGSEEFDVAKQMLELMESFCAAALYNPVKWQILSRILRDFPIFKWSCLINLHDNAERNLELLEITEIRDLMTPDGYTRFLALLGADALFLLDISGGAMDFTPCYRKQPAWSRSLGIIDHWKNRTESNFKHGDETALLHEIAARAGFTKGR